MKKDNGKKTSEQEVDLSRRKFILGGAGLLIAGGIGASLIEPRKANAAPLPALPRPNPTSGQRIPVDRVKKIAWRYYGMASGCCNCTSSALIEGIKYAFGAAPVEVGGIYVPGDIGGGNAWDYIPTGTGGWFKYGAGGIQHWGTICGVPNGASLVLSMMGFTAPLQAMIEQVMMRYSQTKYPTPDAELYDLWAADNAASSTECAKWWGSKKPLTEAQVKGFSISNSPLCHVAISKWSWAANTDLVSSQGSDYYTNKVDRCAKACADVAGFLAEVLNNTPYEPYEIPHDTHACFDCHHPNAGSVIPAQQGHMDCGECHTDLRAHGSAAMGYPPMVGHGAVTVADYTVSFNDASTDSDDAAGTLNVEVNWGDGGFSTGKDGNLFTHTYTAAGKYNITHSVQDPGGNFVSEVIKVAVGMYSLTVNVLESDNDPVVGATVYLKQKKGSGDWKQIMYGYTDSAGSKTYTDLPGGATYSYKVVVYKSGFDFNTGATGIQTKVASLAFTLTADKTLTVQQGNPPTAV